MGKLPTCNNSQLVSNFNSHFVPNITMGMCSAVAIVASVLILPFKERRFSHVSIREFLESSWIVI